MTIFAIFVVAFTSLIGFIEALTRGDHMLAFCCLIVFLAVAIPVVTSEKVKGMMK